jgi:type I restriction enzyme S subunit
MPFTAAEKKRFLLRAGDVLLNEGQSLDLVGRSAIYRGSPPDCCFQNTLVRFRANPDMSPEFAQLVFQHYLRTGVFASIALRTTSIAHLGAGRLAVLPMPIPRKAEQEAIAESLTDADALIESLAQLIAKKRDIKQGAMQELLAGNRRLPNFSQAWEMKALGEVADMRSGGTPPSSIPGYYGGGIPWVSISDSSEKIVGRFGLGQFAK